MPYYISNDIIHHSQLHQHKEYYQFNTFHNMKNIASLHSRQQKCPTCNSQLSQDYNSQLHCPQCNHCPSIYQKEIKFVPQGYRPNSQQVIPRNQVYIQKYLIQFANLCGISLKPEETNTLIIEVMRIRRERGVHSKGYIGHCGAVIYQRFKEVHKMSIRQFCKKGQIKQNIFNKSYLVLHSTQRGMQRAQFANKIKYDKIKRQQNDQICEDVREIVDKVYSSILGGPFLESSREFISAQIVKKTIQLKKRLQKGYNEMNGIENGVFYVIFVVLKIIEVKCCFKKYKELMNTIMGIKLKDKECKQFKQWYHRLINDEGTTTIGNQSLIYDEAHS